MAYVLGQINKTSALPILETVLTDESENAMVRHEVSTASALLVLQYPQRLPGG